jgi:hypothetical protein
MFKDAANNKIVQLLYLSAHFRKVLHSLVQPCHIERHVTSVPAACGVILQNVTDACKAFECDLTTGECDILVDK